MSEPQPSVRATGWQSLTVAAVVGASLGWLLFAIVEAVGWPVPQLPLLVTLVIGVLALGVGVQAVRTHRLIHLQRSSMPATRAVTLLVLGKACLLAGVGFAAGYAAIAGYFWSRQDAALPRERVINSLITVVASIALAIAGAMLERACRVPPSEKDVDRPEQP